MWQTESSSVVDEYDWIKMPEKDEIRLKQCTVVLTRSCNLRCDFCFEKEAGYSLDDQVGFDDLKSLIDLCNEAGMRYVFFTGGEPLTYLHIIDILRYVKDNYPSITSTIATNGILLEDIEFCQRLFDSGLGYVDISMKGADALDWEKATGFDGYAKQLQAICNLSSMSVDFTCSMVVTQDNVTRVCDAVQAAHDHGAKQFSFTFFIDNIESEEKNQTYLEKYNPFTLIGAFVSQIDRLSDITDEWWVEYSFPLCVYSDKQLELLKGRLAGPCQVHLNNAITVNTQLELMPCDMHINTRLGRFGNDFSTFSELEALSEIPEFQYALDEIRKQPSKKCQSCEYLEQCYGGCPVLWKNYSFEALMDLKASMIDG